MMQQEKETKSSHETDIEETRIPETELFAKSEGENTERLFGDIYASLDSLENFFSTVADRFNKIGEPIKQAG